MPPSPKGDLVDPGKRRRRRAALLAGALALLLLAVWAVQRSDRPRGRGRAGSRCDGVERGGPLVRGVCRAVLAIGCTHDLAGSVAHHDATGVADSDSSR